MLEFSWPIFVFNSLPTSALLWQTAAPSICQICIYATSITASTATFTSTSFYFHGLNQKSGIVSPCFSFKTADQTTFDIFTIRTLGNAWQNHEMSSIYRFLIKNHYEVQNWALYFRTLLDLSTALICLR